MKLKPITLRIFQNSCFICNFKIQCLYEFNKHFSCVSSQSWRTFAVQLSVGFVRIFGEGWRFPRVFCFIGSCAHWYLHTDPKALASSFFQLCQSSRQQGDGLLCTNQRMMPYNLALNISWFLILIINSNFFTSFLCFSSSYSKIISILVIYVVKIYVLLSQPQNKTKIFNMKLQTK